MPQQLKKITPRLRLGLFSRSFLLLATLMVVSLGVWLQVFFSMEEGPRARQMAQRVASTVSITHSALLYAPAKVRPSLLLDLATKESLRVQPREISDTLVAMPNSTYWKHVVNAIKARLGPGTQVLWSVNGVPGIWVNFEIDRDQYWLVFDREQLGLTTGIEWFGWGLTALALAIIGAGVSVRFINRPLAQLSKAVQQLARGETPIELPEQGPLEIRELNAAVNRMVRDLHQAEADREIMLAGISHDLRTPLARMRLEIEMSEVSDEAREAIDEDLAQIDHSIEQLMEYARPAGSAPANGVNVSEVLRDIYQRERTHSLSLGDTLSATIMPGLYAKISAHDLKRVINNLIENARRYGRSPDNARACIELEARPEGSWLVIEIRDEGEGINSADINRLLRPFSRGQAARTGVSGAGLGLAIVDRLLRQVGGQLKLLPGRNGGLTARIELPRIKTRIPTESGLST